MVKANEVVTTRCIAPLRIHLECVIMGQIKSYHISYYLIEPYQQLCFFN